MRLSEATMRSFRLFYRKLFDCLDLPVVFLRSFESSKLSLLNQFSIDFLLGFSVIMSYSTLHFSQMTQKRNISSFLIRVHLTMHKGTSWPISVINLKSVRKLNISSAPCTLPPRTTRKSSWEGLNRHCVGLPDEPDQFRVHYCALGLVCTVKLVPSRYGCSGNTTETIVRLFRRDVCTCSKLVTDLDE